MEQFTINLLFVGASFALYIGIAIWARAGSTSEFYAAGRGVHPVTNGMATAADWMSAASFISMAGLIAFTGYDNSTFLMGWTGGYVLLALLLAPYLAMSTSTTLLLLAISWKVRVNYCVWQRFLSLEQCCYLLVLNTLIGFRLLSAYCF